VSEKVEFAANKFPRQQAYARIPTYLAKTPSPGTKKSSDLSNFTTCAIDCKVKTFNYVQAKT
jgi:hypothetical protein